MLLNDMLQAVGKPVAARLSVVKLDVFKLVLFKIEVSDVHHLVVVIDGFGWLPCADMYQRHRLVAEIPQQEQIAVVRIAVALVLLTQAYTVDAVHGGMTHYAEIRELNVNILIGGKGLAEPQNVFFLGAYVIFDTRRRHKLALAAGLALHNIAHDDESLLAEHLAQEVDVLGGIGSAEMLAVVEYNAATLCIVDRKLTRQYLSCLLIERITACHLLQVAVRHLYGSLSGRLCALSAGVRALVNGLIHRAALLLLYSCRYAGAGVEERYVAVAVDKSFTIGIVLAKPKLSVAIAHIEHAVVQRYDKELVAVFICHRETLVSPAINMSDKFKPLIQSVSFNAFFV